MISPLANLFTGKSTSWLYIQAFISQNATSAIERTMHDLCAHVYGRLAVWICHSLAAKVLGNSLHCHCTHTYVYVTLQCHDMEVAAN